MDQAERLGRAERFLYGTSLVAAATSILVLLGWATDLKILERFGSGFIAMNPLTAVCFLLGAVSLALLGVHTQSPLRLGASRVLAAAVVGICTLKIQSLATGWGSGIDLLLFASRLALEPPPHNPMAVPTAFDFVLVGAAILLLGSWRAKLNRAANWVAFAAWMLSWNSLLAYAYGLGTLINPASVPEALPTSLLFLVLASGALSARPEQGPLSQLLSTGKAGRWLRWTFLGLTFLPLMVGGIVMHAAKAMGWGIDAGFTVSTTVLEVAIIVLLSQAIRQMNLAALRVERHSEELAAESRRAEEISQYKSQFLASMSHEIRTPLNAITGVAELLCETPLNEEQGQFVDLLKTSSEALLAVINDILDISKIEANQITLEEEDFSVTRTVERTMAMLAPTAHRKKLELLCDIGLEVPETLNGDPLRLQQVLINLVSNAIKFTEAGEVSVVLSAPDPACRHRLRFEVRDTGIGIPQEVQDRIFERFTQADASTTRKYGGSGLGLAIAKSLIGLMHGDLQVQSTPGRGSTFTFSVELAPQRSPEPARHAETQELDLGLRLLVVDDNSANQVILSRQLQAFGCQVQVAGDGPGGLAAWKAAATGPEAFEAIIVDSRMPVMDGFAFVRELRRLDRGSEVPTLMLTSDNRASDYRQLRESGIDGYLTKPVRRSDLRRTLARALNRSTQGLSTASQTVPATQEIRPLRILLAEDAPANQTIFKAFLASRPYEVTIAADGRQALEAFESTDFDIVFMDAQMPELDGYAATRAIRALEKAANRPRKPIVALTAHALKEDRDRCIEAGCDAYLSKPFKKEALWALIEELTREPSDAAR